MFGCGKTHSINLDKNILLNRVAGQISLGAYPFLKFPKKLKKFDYNFMEWKSKHKNPNINKLKSTDWPPRAVFGKAMQYKFFDLMYLYRNHTNINIKLVFDKVVKVKKKKQFTIVTDDNRHFISDSVLIATGNYISNKKLPKIIKINGPSKKKIKINYENNFLSKLDEQSYWKKIKNKKIIIFGMGVSSLDVIEKLSNKKNKLYPISRTFLFPFARPLNQKLSRPGKLDHKPILFTEEITLKLKKLINDKKNLNKINFNKFIYPFLKIEFYLIYFKEFLFEKDFHKLLVTANEICKNKKNYQKLDFSNLEETINNFLIDILNNNKFKKVFYKKNWFSNEEILRNIRNKKYCFFDFFSNPLILEKNFSKEYVNFLNWDINEARKGNLSSPFKKASDGLWRDLRHLITILFDDCKNLKLLNYFLNNILTVHNRMCDGPSLQSIEKIKNHIHKKNIILTHKDVHDFSILKKSLIMKTKSKKIKIDYIFNAIASIYKKNYKNDNLINSMISNKLVETNKQISGNLTIGLKLNEKQNPVVGNKTIKKIRFVGPASEGPKFFHHTLSRPDKKQFNYTDLSDWTKSI